MKTKDFFIALMCALCVLTSCGYERIDAGHEGIKVNLYGDKKGVDDVELVTGAVWYNPWTTAVYEYPTYVQTIDYEPFAFNSQDGSVFTFDPTIMLSIKGDAEAEYNRKISASLSSLIIQQDMIDKWDGKTPVFMGASNTMLDASNFVK